jgi:urease accessory protein
MKTRHLILTTAVAVAMPALAAAHPGHDGHAGFFAGALHPLTGLDHLATLLGVGLWAARQGARLCLIMVGTFLVLMLTGGCMGVASPGFGYADQAIAASLLMLGLLIVSVARLPAIACLALTGCFAWFNGFAHAVELPQHGSVAAFLSGMLLGSAGLLLAGLGLGLAVSRRLALASRD